MFLKKWPSPIIDLRKIRLCIRSYIQYWRDWNAYSNMTNSETLSLHDAYPCLYDQTATTPFDTHYFYQDIWAFKAIKASGTPSHIDVGSRAIFVGMLTAITKVTFIDIRPLIVDLENFDSKPGSILALPFRDNSVPSLSCLHVAEHIGLGRYGDRLDPNGTKKACKELSRILAVNGNLYFSLPVGKQKTYFNAHRVHSPRTIIDYFKDLELVEISGVTDSGRFIENISMAVLEKSNYACGLFWFKKIKNECDNDKEDD